MPREDDLTANRHSDRNGRRVRTSAINSGLLPTPPQSISCDCRLTSQLRTSNTARRRLNTNKASLPVSQVDDSPSPPTNDAEGQSRLQPSDTLEDECGRTLTVLLPTLNQFRGCQHCTSSQEELLQHHVVQNFDETSARREDPNNLGQHSNSSQCCVDPNALNEPDQRSNYSCGTQTFETDWGDDSECRWEDLDCSGSLACKEYEADPGHDVWSWDRDHQRYYRIGEGGTKRWAPRDLA
jgi:hypothetical protein